MLVDCVEDGGVKINLRPVTNADRAFAERVYFETQRWIIEELFGWRGDDLERAKFAESFDERNAKVIVLDGEDCGWLAVLRSTHGIELSSIYIVPAKQGQGLGTILIVALIDEAASARLPLTLSTAKINPARSLYDRLGFRLVKEEEYKVYLRHDAH